MAYNHADLEAAIAKFHSCYVVTKSGCWLWQRSLVGSGYGQLRYGADRRIRFLAHRFSYTLVYGEIPLGTEIDHLCRVRHCVNPNHLEAVTHQENIIRSVKYRPDEYDVGEACRRGHERSKWTGVNTKGKRFCRKCASIHQKNHRQRYNAAQLKG
jgi:hypothetical protein